jgi:hypothetical protein
LASGNVVDRQPAIAFVAMHSLRLGAIRGYPPWRMARGKATPYPAQLQQFLAQLNGEQVTFSVTTLYDEFQHGPTSKAKTNAGRIHNALYRAWPTGTVISYIDDEGNVLREDGHFQPGSAAISHPQIFGTPETPSPKEGYRPVSYQDYTHCKGAHAAGDDELSAGRPMGPTKSRRATRAG